MIGDLGLRDQLITWVDRAIDVQDGVLQAYLTPENSGNPPSSADSARATTSMLEDRYLATVSGTGAVVGGAASVPGVGTGLALGLSVAETVAFLDATALFTLTAATSVGCRVTDLDRRRALLLVVLLGDEAVRLVPPSPDGEVDGWGHRLIALGDVAVADITRTAEKWLVTRFGARQGLLMLGRLAPFGVGAAVGAAGNALTAKGVITRVRSAFAGAPTQPAHAVEEPAVAPPTGKYAGLFRLLEDLTDDDLTLTIAAVETAVTGGLPAAARQNAAWWGNTPDTRAPQTKAWLAAGFHVAEVELADDRIRLRRGPSQRSVSSDSPASTCSPVTSRMARSATDVP